MNYCEKLILSAEKTGNIVCMGLDPVLDAFPGQNLPVEKRISEYLEKLFNEIKKQNCIPSAFKPNLGYYARLDSPRDGKFSGSKALASVLNMINELFSDIPVILDSKRGDIATSSLNYAVEAFDCWKADAVTVSPYMGTDSVMPFAYENKGVYILNRTSNPGGKDIQNLEMKNGKPLYLTVSEKIAEWAKDCRGIGAVAGATNLKEFEDISFFYGSRNIPMLIPGVGSQGGTAPEVMELMRKTSYPLKLARINSSSGLTHPWKKGPAPCDAVEQSIEKLRKLISEASLR